MKYYDMPECDEAEQKEFFERASEFLKSTNLYNDSKGTAKTAIADFLAYSVGKKLKRIN